MVPDNIVEASFSSVSQLQSGIPFSYIRVPFIYE
jgi:hypothetical protein